jgi:hypothetical protein
MLTTAHGTADAFWFVELLDFLTKHISSTKLAAGPFL